ncbi:MAG: YebC/PmpR family DNA-binding transcriptional regulator [Phycisphaerae bacterium]
MSGHSKWSTIKHKKARLDAKRGKNWGKLARNITIAAKNGGNPADNPRLRLAIDKARADNMPNDTIDKAIKKGTGENEGESYEEVLYEGYAPNGVAVMARALTDNRNRTAPEIKKIFERHGGNIGPPNCVAWMFSPKGVFIIKADSVSEDRLMEVALENGAEDVSTSASIHEVICAPEDYEALRSSLQEAEILIESSDVTNIAATTVSLDLDAAKRVLKLIDSLEEQDDVESVSANFDIPDEVMAQLT